MNVNLQEHQRSIMATMGIDLWIPRSDVHTRLFENGLYRDVAIAETIQLEQKKTFIADVSGTVLAETQTAVATSKTSIVQSNSSTNEVSLLQFDVDTQQQVEISTAEQIQQNTDFQTTPIVQLDAFEIQAYCFENCIVLVDCTQLDADQSKLWLNIQHALFGQFYDLKWPFPMLQFQDGRGVKLYIQGFIDGLKKDKKVLSLGQLPYLQSTDIIQLASLQEMIEQPKLKKRLWQFMQS